MKYRNLFLVVLLLVLTTCKREWNNIYDGNTELEPTEWAPTNFAKQLNNNNVELSWSFTIKAQGFKIDKAVNDVWQNNYAVLPPESTTFSDTAINPFSNSYQYRIYSFLGSKTSAIQTVTVDKYSYSVDFSNITDSSMTLTGSIDTEATITERGFCYGATSEPQTTGTTVKTTINNYAIPTKLQAGKTYHAVLYVKANKGTFYSAEKEQTMPVWTVASVNTQASSSLSYTSVTLNASIEGGGGAPVTERGFYYGLEAKPHISGGTKAVAGTGSGSFSKSISNLTPNTHYFVVAYVTNCKGTSFSSEFSFETKSLTTPTVTTASASNIQYTTATGGGNVTDDGGISVSWRGVCWSTTHNPTNENSHTNDGTGSGAFTSSISGLSSGTTYYVRAYATNSLGTSYGTEVSFRTTSFTIPTVSTTAITNIKDMSATGGGNVTFDGGTTVIARGVCWSTSSSPTLNNSVSYDGAGVGTFTSQITGLKSNTKYYVRAYATNSEGTAYGSEQSFTTKPSLTGTWNKSFTITSQYTTYSGTLEIVQHDDNTLTGSFEFSDGSGYYPLQYGSLISGSNVTIIWTLETYKLVFTGPVNTSYSSMSGNYTANGTAMGPWSATKESKKGTNKAKHKKISDKDSFLNLVKLKK